MVLLRCAWVILFFTVVLTSAYDFEEVANEQEFEDGTTTETTLLLDDYETSTTPSLNEEEGSPVNYKGAKVFRVEITNKVQKNLMRSLSDKNLIDVWSSTKGKVRRYDFMVMPENFEVVKKRFKQLNMTSSLFINDVQKLISEENPKIKKFEEEDRTRAGYSLNWDAYFKYGTIYDFMDYFASEYPDLCKVQTIGKTVEGREMKLLTISSGGNTQKPAIFIDGGMHAREWISPATVTYIIRELVENRTNYGSFVDDVDFHIIPVVNVDGYDYTHSKVRMWRKNKADLKGLCNGGTGVDLNRNFGYKWGGIGASRLNTCSSTYAGPEAFSEPESRAIRDYIMSFSPGVFKGYVTFHSYGQVMVYPWGYTTALTPDSDELKSVSKKAAAAIKAIGKRRYASGSISRVLYRASGNSLDWAKAVAEIKYSYCVELPDKGFYGFTLPARFIKPIGRDTMEIVRVIAEEVLKSRQL